MQEADSNFFECKDYSKEVATATKVTVQHVDHIDTVRSKICFCFFENVDFLAENGSEDLVN